MVGPWKITPESFSGRKFQKRYDLMPRDFVVTQEKDGFLLRLTRELPQVPADPIFEPPDPPEKIAQEQLSAEAKLDSQAAREHRALISTLAEELTILRLATVPPFPVLTEEELFRRYDEKLKTSK
jgi:hypothetical protein